MRVDLESGLTDTVENLVLEHLKRFQASQDRTERKLDEVVGRIGQLEVSVAGLRRDVAHSEKGIAAVSVRIDRLGERIDRIDRRLEISA